MPSRRDMLLFLAASAVAGGTSRAFASPLTAAAQPDLRGAIDAVEYRAIPESGDRKGPQPEQMIKQAAAENVPVFLPPGTYRIFAAENVRRIELSISSSTAATAGSAIMPAGSCNLPASTRC